MLFKCLECGKKFKTAKSAQRAANNGCPGCGGVDIDINYPDDAPAAPKRDAVLGKNQPDPDGWKEGDFDPPSPGR